MVYEENRVEDLVKMLTKNDLNIKSKAVAHAVSLRVPLPDLAFVDAFRKRSGGESRQKICIYLLQAGIEQVLERLDEDSRRRLENMRIEELSALMGQKEDRELWDSEEN